MGGWGPSPQLSAWATQCTAPKKLRCGGEPLATLYPICPTRNSNSRPPALIANALTTELTGQFFSVQLVNIQLFTEVMKLVEKLQVLDSIRLKYKLNVSTI